MPREDRTAIERLLQEHWGIEVTDIRGVNDGTNSLNYQVVSENQSQYLLKVTPASEQWALVPHLAIQQFCYEQNAPVPAIIPSLEQPFSYVCKGDRVFSLQQYISGGRFSGSLDEIALVGTALAKVNVVVSALAQTLHDDPRYQNLAKWERRQLIESLALRPDVYVAVSSLPELYKRFQTHPSVPQAAYIDCHVHNVIFSEDRAILVDLGSVKRSLVAISAAFACHRFCGFDRRKARLFFGAYRGVADPECDEETYPEYVAIEAIRRMNYILRGLRLGYHDGGQELTKQLGIATEATDEMERGS